MLGSAKAAPWNQPLGLLAYEFQRPAAAFHTSPLRVALNECDGGVLPV